MSNTVLAVLIFAGLLMGVGLEWLATRRKIEALVAGLAQKDAIAKGLEDVAVRMRDAFATASREALEANSQSFLNLARVSMTEFQQGARTDLQARQESIDRIIGPVNERLLRMDENLKSLERDRVACHTSLIEHLRHMSMDQQKLVTETNALGRALRVPHVRGQWGEMQLRRTVEIAGMLEHCDFVEQQTVHADGRVLRPDLVVNLPRGKVIVVDAKAPLSAFLEAMEAVDDAQRDVLLDRHARQVRDHINALAAKDYSEQFTQAPDFVVLFLPGEAFFSAACQRDPAIVEHAVRIGVIPASPTTLITLLKSVAYGWQQERIAERAEEIRDLGIELHGRVCVFADHLGKMRKALEGAVSAYNSSVSSLETRVLPTARRFRDLGANGKSDITFLETIGNSPRLPNVAELVRSEPSTH